jgi:DNA-binding MarR family transcriptional regulator
MALYDDCIVFLLAKAYQKAHGIFKRHLMLYGLTPVQHLILETLWEKEGLSAGEISRRLALDGATLSGVLDRMVEKQWIEKKTDREDKRLLRIHLTARAKEFATVLLKERKKANEEILKRFTLEEKIVLKRLLRDFKD